MTPNSTPFVTTINDFINYPVVVLEQILLNILFFVPFGFLFTMLYAKNRKEVFKTIIVALVFAIGIEIVELLVGRYMDIDNILWNTTGAIIGSNFYVFFNYIIKPNKLSV